MKDVRYAIRQLARSPGFTAVALLTLTLGMGATSAFFGVLHGVVLQDPPYPNAGRLMAIHNRRAGQIADGGRLSRGEARDYRERQRAFDGLAAADLGRMTLTATANGGPVAERVKVSRVTANLFPIFGITPARGRGFETTDERGGMSAVISHELWRARFGGAENILGRTIRLNGLEYAVVGVMPAGFDYPEPDMGAWLPLDLSPRDNTDRTDHYLALIGRRAEGVSAAAAADDLARVARDLQRDAGGAYPADPQWSIGAGSLRETLFGRLFGPLALLMAAAGAVLLIACVNVAIMSLLRALTRRREISIRVAIGASRRALVRQLLIEAGVLSFLGAVGGLVLGSAMLDALKAFAPPDIPRLHDLGINLPVAMFSAVVLIGVTLVVGLAPALVALRVNPFDALRSAGRSSEGVSTTRLRDALTVAEVALASMLLLCAGLTLRSFNALLNVDLGFSTEQRFAFKTNLTPREYPDAARVDGFYQKLTASLESLPGVRSVAAISYLPLSGEGQTIDAARADAGSDAPKHTVQWSIVRGPYFETMGVALVQGRLFSIDDRPGSLPVAIVDDELARRLWSSEAAAIGQAVTLGAGQTRTIVGVVRHVSHVSPGRPSLPMAYAPQSQVYQRGMYTVVGTTGDPARLTASIRAAVASADPSIPMYFAETVGGRYDAALALPRFTAGLVSAFSVLALVLAGVGIFGVTAYAVAQRTREFGIRLALGAQRSDVGALVLGRAGRLAAIGLAIGGLLGINVAPLLSSVLFGVESSDALTMLLVLLGIGVTTLAASLSPLRRAMLVSPIETLRAE